MNKKLFTIIKREYITRVRTKGFIIGTILFPLVLTFLFGGVYLFMRINQPSTKRYYVIDQSGMVYEEFTEILSDTLSNGKPKYAFTEKQVSSEDMEDLLKEYQESVLQKEIDGYIIIPEDLVKTKRVRYSARSVSNIEEQYELSNALSWITTNYRLENKGLDPEVIRKKMEEGRVRLESLQVTDKGEVEREAGASQLFSTILIVLLYMLILIYGSMVMKSVIEEKSERITETVISSVKPVHLMLGKIIGICSLGITQLVVTGMFLYIALTHGGSILMKFGVDTPAILELIQGINFSLNIFVFLIVFFLLGYIFYASVYAGIGSMFNSNDEAQQLSMVVILPIIIGYFIAISIGPERPDAPALYWTSIIPFTAPLVMFVRIVATDPNLPSGVFLSIAILAVSIVLVVTLNAKIFRVGILMYGKKPSLKEVLKWIRYK